MRAAVYAGTRNVYQDMIPSMKSLLIHSNVDKIYFLIEDNKFPYELPPEVECINVSKQQWFNENSPQMKNRCSYMVLLRVVFTKLFPHLDRILTIDNDTIVRENISELWDMDMTDYYIAGCLEPKKSGPDFTYINMGVAMLNLAKWREDGLDEKLVQDLNTYYFEEAEQTAINLACQKHTLILDPMYNRNTYTFEMDGKQQVVGNEKIIHYAAIKKWQELPLIKKYRNCDIKRNVYTNHSLNIIIPHYNNVEGLRQTIESVYGTRAIITVVDDCSTKLEGYEELQKEFPNVHYLKLEHNAGPGAARQYALDNIYTSYVTFIDAGDYVASKEILEQVLDNLEKYNQAYVFCYTWFNEEDGNFFVNDASLLQGKIFSREFIDLYHLRFSSTPECSYSNEDRGFMAPCKIALEYITSYDKLWRFYPIDLVFLIKTFDDNSITHANKGEFYYYKHIRGFTYNTEHIVKICKENGLHWQYIMKYVTWGLVYLYECYLRCVAERPEMVDKNLDTLKYFYKNIYKQFEKVNSKELQLTYYKATKYLKKWISLQEPHLNINRFLRKIQDD